MAQVVMLVIDHVFIDQFHWDPIENGREVEMKFEEKKNHLILTLYTKVNQTLQKYK